MPNISTHIYIYIYIYIYKQARCKWNFENTEQIYVLNWRLLRYHKSPLLYTKLCRASGHRLSNWLIYEKEVHSVMVCGHLCLFEHPRCKSMNYEKGKKQQGLRRSECQLNNDTRATRSKEFVPDFAFNFAFDFWQITFELFTVSQDFYSQNYETITKRILMVI